jgi:hypothetical protein
MAAEAIEAGSIVGARGADKAGAEGGGCDGRLGHGHRELLGHTGGTVVSPIRSSVGLWIGAVGDQPVGAWQAPRMELLILDPTWVSQLSAGV